MTQNFHKGDKVFMDGKLYKGYAVVTKVSYDPDNKIKDRIESIPQVVVVPRPKTGKQYFLDGTDIIAKKLRHVTEAENFPA